jgi:tRNA_anti-like
VCHETGLAPHGRVTIRANPMTRSAAVLLLIAGLLAAGCADRLPDQDRRITVTPVSAKLPAENLWKDYRADRAAADRKYWGKVVEVTGRVTGTTTTPGAAAVMFAQEETAGVQANLLDDQTTPILAAAVVGQRLTLKCFCAGLDGNVVLKSCVRP